MELLILALLAAGGIYLVSQSSSVQADDIGSKGTYVDALGNVWQLATQINSTGQGIHWEAVEATAATTPVGSASVCVYRLATNNECVRLSGATHDDVVAQINQVVAAYRKEKGI